jgi:hypothetical protein
MKNILCSIILLIFLSCIAKTQEEENVEKEDQGNTFAVNASYLSRYIRRGFDLNGGRSVFQPSVTAGLPFDFSLEVTGSIGIRRKQLDEVDVDLYYETEIFQDWLDMSITFSTYQYLGTEGGIYLTGSTEYANSQEIIINFTTRNTLIEISAEYGRGLGGRDGGDNVGNYASISVSKDYVFEGLVLSSGVSGTYLDQFDIPQKITDVSMNNDVTFNMGDFTFQPTLSFVYLPSPQILNDNDEDTIVFWGIDVSYGW